jgi:anti-anti-sigma factor
MTENGAALQIEIEENPAGDAVVRVEGELSLRTASQLRDALMEARVAGRKTILDSSRLKDVDLTGLQLICSAHRSYQNAGAKFELASKPEILLEVSKAAGFHILSSVCRHRRTGGCCWRD